MTEYTEPPAIIVMGVSGSGKTLIGKKLALALNASSVEGDLFHPSENIERMRKGIALGDEHRAVWLERIGAKIRSENMSGRGAVAACSALRLVYRDQLRAMVPRLCFLFLDIDRNTANNRVASRQNHFMPASLVASQFETLEPLAETEKGLRIDATLPPDSIVDQALAHFCKAATDR